MNRFEYHLFYGDYIPWKQYEKIVDREIKNLNIKEIQSQFKNIFNTSLLSLLNYESGLRNFNSYKPIGNNSYESTSKNFCEIIQRDILSKFSTQINFNLEKSLHQLLDITFDSFGFITDKGFKLNKEMNILVTRGFTIVPGKYTKSNIISKTQEAISSYPTISNLIKNVRNNDELANVIKNMHETFISLHFTSTYLQHIENNISKEKQNEYFINFLDFIYKFPALCTKINSNKKTLEQLNNLIGNNEELFSNLMEKFPGLGQFFKNFELSKKSVQEISFSKLFQYHFYPIGKELSIVRSDNILVKNLLYCCLEKFKQFNESNDTSANITYINFASNIGGVLFSSANENVIEEDYKKFNKFFNHCCKDIFLNDTLKLQSIKKYNDKLMIIEMYIEKEIIKFDLEQNIPINKTVEKNSFKF